MPGRNDPCPCGSGKKYKRCCWTKDKAAQLATHPAMNEASVTETIQNEFVETSLPPLVGQPKPEPEPDPFLEQLNTYWEAFESASYEKKWTLIDDVLANEPELCDGEMVFETTNRLFERAVERRDIERFSRLLDRFEAVVPEAYRAELAYILDWRIQIALIEEDHTNVERYFYQFSSLAGDKLDQYYRVISALAYHGELEILLTGMRQARPYVAEGGDLVPWAYEEFVDKLASLEILSLLEHKPGVTADDPELNRRFGEYEVTIKPEGMNLRLDYLTGWKLPAWTLADFERLAGKGKNKPANSQFSYLLDAFTHYAHDQEGTPLTKAEMARQELFTYCVRRDKGELGSGRRQQPSHKRSAPKQAQRHSLYPDAKTLDRYLAELIGFLSFRYYEASALFEIIPAWLRFLRKYDLLDEKTHQQTLKSLNYLKGHLLQFARGRVTDPLVEKKLSSWPYDAAGEE